ncbi:MAG: response regulator [Chloroflexota bacterium]
MPTPSITQNDDNNIDSLRYQIEQLQDKIKFLNEADDARRDFLAHIAHELRTPLNTIIGFSQILDRHTQLDEEQHEYLTLILLSSEHLMSLINNILELSKLEAGEVTLNITEFDLRKLLEEIKSIYHAHAIEKQITFYINFEDVPQYIHGDETKIRQILDNLLSNAFKFTDEGSVTLAISEDEQGTQNESFTLHFNVADTGQGIKEDELIKLFEPYQQTTTGENANKGTGLGLAIKQKLINLMNGQLQVESTWGSGTTFSVCIQVQKSNRQTPLTQTSKIISLDLSQQHYRVLIVDDNADNRQLLTKILTTAGFEIQTAQNGIDAIRLYQTWQPHLILMDMRMPLMNGYEATKKIRQLTDETHKVPIIAFTANAFDHELGAIQDAGCNDYIVKPFQVSRLYEVIGKHLNLSILYDRNHSLLTERQPHLASELRSLSTDDLAHLVAVASTFSVEQVRSIIPMLPPNLANYIEERLNEFDFDSIIALSSAKTG